MDGGGVFHPVIVDHWQRVLGRAELWSYQRDLRWSIALSCVARRGLEWHLIYLILLLFRPIYITPQAFSYSFRFPRNPSILMTFPYRGHSPTTGIRPSYTLPQRHLNTASSSSITFVTYFSAFPEVGIDRLEIWLSTSCLCLMVCVGEPSILSLTSVLRNILPGYP